MLAALLASVALLARPSGRAGAATTLSNVSVDVRYGCPKQNHKDDFVEVTLTPGAQALDGSDPQIVQVGLASDAADNDLYPEGGPTLVELASGAVLVRLAGPVSSGQHVFVRDYGNTAYRNFALPATCQNVEPTPFGLADPDIYGNHQVTCAANSASMHLTLKNNNDSAVDYTVLLVRKDGQLSGAQAQGIPVTLAGQEKQPVTVTQPPTKATIFQYQVRVIAPDGQVTDVADVTMRCDSQPGPHPTITPTPVRPSHSPSSRPSSSPPASHSPSSSPSHSRPHPSATPTLTSASSQPRPTSSATAANPPASRGTTGGNGSAPATHTSASGPVLGDASSTSQPQPPHPLPTPSKQVIVEAGRVNTAFNNPGFTGAIVLVLVAFAGAMGALLAANNASARRR